MLQSFDFAIITVEEAKVLVKFIEKRTASKKLLIDYEKMKEFKVFDVYKSLQMFINNSEHYNHELRYLDTENL